MDTERHPAPIPPLSYDGQPETRAFWVGNLPHWDVLGRPIFLTLHVRGAIPRAAAARIRAESAAVNDCTQTDYVRRLKRVFAAMEKWLDRADHHPILTQPGVTNLLREAIHERQQRGWWRVVCWVVMPSHVHLLYVGGTVGMRALIGDFKRWTGHQAARMQGGGGVRFWQDEWFDHWSRSEDETERIVHYIKQNPVRAGLAATPWDWPSASWHKPASGRSGLQ